MIYRDRSNAVAGCATNQSLEQQSKLAAMLELRNQIPETPPCPPSPSTTEVDEGLECLHDQLRCQLNELRSLTDRLIPIMGDDYPACGTDPTRSTTCAVSEAVAGAIRLVQDCRGVIENINSRLRI
jgi:hypothetical protein